MALSATRAIASAYRVSTDRISSPLACAPRPDVVVRPIAASQTTARRSEHDIAGEPLMRAFTILDSAARRSRAQRSYSCDCAPRNELELRLSAIHRRDAGMDGCCALVRSGLHARTAANRRTTGRTTRSVDAVAGAGASPDAAATRGTAAGAPSVGRAARRLRRRADAD